MDRWTAPAARAWDSVIRGVCQQDNDLTEIILISASARGRMTPSGDARLRVSEMLLDLRAEVLWRGVA